MSTTHSGLAFKRFTRQVRTEMTAVLATSAAAHQAETLLKSAPWVEQTDTQGTFPARNALQDGFSGTWEAFKHVGNYAAGYQRAYAGMVAYRFQLPADASGKDVVSVDVPLYVDRWLVDGVRVAAYLSDDTTPATDWDTLREGGGYLSAQLPMAYTDDDPPLRVVVEKNDTLTITFAAPIAAEDYLWVVVSLEDYTTSRDFWIEGAALILGEAVEATFSAAVAADTVVATPPAEKQVLENVYYNVSTTSWKKSNWQLKSWVADPTLRLGYAAGISGFPVGPDRTELQFDGATGALVGYSGTTNNVYTGVIIPRMFHLGETDVYTRMRFGATAVFPMAAKEFAARMVVWIGDVTQSDTDTNMKALTARPDFTAEGYLQQALWKGYAAVTVANKCVALAQTAWSLTKIGEFILKGKNYTNEDYFDVNISGPGLKVLVVCVSLDEFWATAAGTMATANATFTPGTTIYLS